MTRLFDRLYADSLSGRILNENFARLISKYQTEQERFERLIEDIKWAQDNGRLKEENALEWVQRMKNIRTCVMEIVNEEIIFA